MPMQKIMNTLQIEAKLAEQYKYKKLPAALSKQYRQLYLENIPSFLSINGGGPLYSKNGTLICSSYKRIVIGDYGAFIEFNDPNFSKYMIAPGEEYRVKDPRYKDNIKYIWLTLKDNSNIKIYYQKKPVTYADYKPGMLYVSVHEVIAYES